MIKTTMIKEEISLSGEDVRSKLGRSILRVFSYIHKNQHLAWGMLIFAVLTTLFDLIPPWFIKLLIDKALPSGDRHYLTLLVAGVVGAYVLRNIANSLRIRTNNTLEQRVIFAMRNDVYAALQRLPIPFYEKTSTGQLMSRVNDDINNVERVFIDGTEQFVVALLTLIGITCVLFAMNWRLACVALLPIPLLAISAIIFTRTVHKYYQIIRHNLGEMIGFLQDRISGIREIKIYGREAHEEENFSQKNRTYSDSQLKVAEIWSVFSPTMRLLAAMGVVLILIDGSRQVMRGTLTLGELVAFISYLGLFYEPVNQIHSLNHMVQHAIAAGERVFEILETPAEPIVLVRELNSGGEEMIGKGERDRPVLSPSTSLRVNSVEGVSGNIQFHAVTFAYQKDRPVLYNISFSVERGEKIALVGPSGAGKSTILKLIPRFYLIQSGEIYLDEQPLTQIPLDFLRSQISMVFQEPFLFNGTIWENITYAKPNATESEVQAVARTCYIDSFIEHLPKRYQTWVGERGIRLSVGQKQRITIARALLKNAPILLMDEPTSNLDTETEELIRLALRNLMKNRTTLIIAHRLSTIQDADRILVMDEGHLVSEGKHAQLYGENPLYTRLYDAMFSALT